MNQPIMVAGIGEVLWDVLEDKEELGGAPINFAYHINALGGQGIPVSTVGDDKRGHQALAQLTARGLTTEYISITESFETGYVQVTVDDNGIPSYTFPFNIAWDHLLLNEHLLSLIPSFQGVCFGTLAQRSEQSRRAIYSFIDGLPPNVLKIYDLNLRQNFYNQEIIETSLSKAHILKLSDEELQVIQDMLGLPDEEHPAITRLMKNFDLRLVVVTRGGNGSLLVSPTEQSEHPGFPSQVEDTIGAGDSFTAATTLGFLLGHDLGTINEYANRLAAYVCTKKGAMPPIPDEFKLV